MSCCAKPVTRIIKVADLEAGIMGLDQALQNVFVSGITDEGEIQQGLLRWIKAFGNYISPARESDYRSALLREYRNFVNTIEQTSDRTRLDQGNPKKG